MSATLIGIIWGYVYVKRGYEAAVLLVGWGIAHLFPTKNVVKGFGDISLDKQRVITMEWINEGATLIFVLDSAGNVCVGRSLGVRL